jgi:hypothetical protein
MAASRYAIGGAAFTEKTEVRIEERRSGRVQDRDVDLPLSTSVFRISFLIWWLVLLGSPPHTSITQTHLIRGVSSPLTALGTVSCAPSSFPNRFKLN